jgi:integrase
LAKGPENGPDVKAEAERRYHEIKLVAQVQTEGDRSPCIAVLDAFLVEIRSHKKPNTYAMWRWVLQDFCKELGTVRIRDLKQHQVTAWLAKKEEPRTHPLSKRLVKWGPGTRRIAISALKAAFYWAKEQGIVTQNPVAGMKSPPRRSRGAEQVVTKEQHEKMLAEASPQFRDFLVALNDTGARPGAIATVTAADFRPDLGAWVLGDLPGRKKKKLTVYLTPQMMELSARLGEQHPTGPLFRNRHGRPWNTSTIGSQFGRLRKKLGLGPISAYSYRHKFATEFLLHGGGSYSPGRRLGARYLSGVRAAVPARDLRVGESK